MYLHFIATHICILQLCSERMITFTSSLTDDLFQQLVDVAGKSSLPKNQLIKKRFKFI